MSSPTVMQTGTSAAMLSVHDTDRRTVRAEFGRLAEAMQRYPDAAEHPSAATAMLERAIRTQLGKPAAVLLPTGKLAQQIALRIHADRRPGRRTFLAHPTNHVTTWEDGNHAVVHGLHARLVGDRHELMNADDLRDGLHEDVAAVVWELPQRELGGELPTWPDLVAQQEETRGRGVATHLDGARVWQAVPFYGRTVAEICAGFDSVYVSLYKDLEAPRGAVLVGDDAFIAAARVWRHRLGGTIDEMWPLGLLGLAGLERVTARMPDYVTHARALAHAIGTQTRAGVRPDPPHAAMFHLHLPVGAQRAAHAREQVVAEGGPVLGLRVRTGPEPDRSCLEVTIGETALTVSTQLAVDAVTRLIEIAEEHA